MGKPFYYNFCLQQWLINCFSSFIINIWDKINTKCVIIIELLLLFSLFIYLLHVSLVWFRLIINTFIHIQFYSNLTYSMHIWMSLKCHWFSVYENFVSHLNLISCHFQCFYFILANTFVHSGFIMFIYTKSSLLWSFISWSHSSNLFVLFMCSMFPWSATVFQALCSPLQYFTTRMKITQTTCEIFWAIYLFTSIIIFR